MDQSEIPDDFGLFPGGTPISNKTEILKEVDQSFGYNRPPDLEYILVRPFSRINLPLIGYGISYNTFGHSAVRYTHPETGQQIIVNIEGKKEHKNMVQFRDPNEYLYGTDSKYTGDQLALYNRNMITVRVHHVPPEKILAMHHYFLDLQEDFNKGNKLFYLIPLQYRDILSKVYPYEMIRYGNCAKWISEGLKKAGVITHKSYWPKAIWINMFESYQQTEIGTLNNMSVVSYRMIKHAHQQYANGSPSITQVAPLQTFRTLSYFNLEKFAHRIVEVPEGSTRAKIEIVENPKKPSEWRNILNHGIMIGLSGILTGFVVARQSGLIHASKFLYQMARRHQINRQNWNSQLQQAQREAANFRRQQKK